MKKIMNRPGDIVSEMCHGLILANPGLKWDSHYKIVSRVSPNPGKVTLISGGGSGHEPAHAGFVGPGMLDAAVCGDVFASPSQIQVYQALRQTRGNRGTLLIIKNYSGDMMNFKNAAFLAQEDGMLVDYVKVEDDIAVQDSLYTIGRRGVAGTVFVHKIAGAAAERGYELARVKELAQRTADHVRTIGFAETSCTVPAKGTPTFQLGEGEIEYGVGIHGEPGRSREPLTSADTLARRMTEQLLSELGLDQGQDDEIALLINGLGATPAQELYVLNHSVRQILSEHPGLQVVCSLVGNYMTSIDMAGASVSILKLDSELKELLFDPCETAGWTLKGPQLPVPYEPLTGTEHSSVEVDGSIQTDPAWAVIRDEKLTLSNLIYLVDAMSACIICNEKTFCELDSFAGDGDFGMSVAKGFRQLKRGWNRLTAPGATLEQFLLDSSIIIMEYCGGASGPIWGSGFRAAGRYCQGKDTLSKQEFAEMLAAVVQGIQTTGERSFGRGAQVGDKTLMDALIPCAQVWQEKSGTELTMLQLFQEGARAAVEGAKSTEKIVARMGRAGTVGERSLGYPDAGAHALGVIFTELSKQLG